jgi:hypothetical protein
MGIGGISADLAHTPHWTPHWEGVDIAWAPSDSPQLPLSLEIAPGGTDAHTDADTDYHWEGVNLVRNSLPVPCLAPLCNNG